MSKWKVRGFALAEGWPFSNLWRAASFTSAHSGLNAPGAEATTTRARAPQPGDETRERRRRRIVQDDPLNTKRHYLCVREHRKRDDDGHETAANRCHELNGPFLLLLSSLLSLLPESPSQITEHNSTTRTSGQRSSRHPRLRAQRSPRDRARK